MVVVVTLKLRTAFESFLIDDQRINGNIYWMFILIIFLYKNRWLLRYLVKCKNTVAVLIKSGFTVSKPCISSHMLFTHLFFIFIFRESQCQTVPLTGPICYTSRPQTCSPSSPVTKHPGFPSWTATLVRLNSETIWCPSKDHDSWYVYSWVPWKFLMLGSKMCHFECFNNKLGVPKYVCVTLRN